MIWKDLFLAFIVGWVMCLYQCEILGWLRRRLGGLRK